MNDVTMTEKYDTQINMNYVSLILFYVRVHFFFLSSLSAGLLRQATYTTTRLGVYTSLMEHFKRFVVKNCY